MCRRVYKLFYLLLSLLLSTPNLLNLILKIIDIYKYIHLIKDHFTQRVQINAKFAKFWSCEWVNLVGSSRWNNSPANSPLQLASHLSLSLSQLKALAIRFRRDKCVEIYNLSRLSRLAHVSGEMRGRRFNFTFSFEQN